MDGTTTTRTRHPLAFTGQGGEYFRIWIVNLALTLLTLGIYSAWAKVRRLQYFYRNTTLAEASFDYHGDPRAILKGRLIGVGLLALYNVTFMVHPALGALIFLGLIGVFPWLAQRSLAFKLHNSSYRGLRFRFLGNVNDAYKVFLGWPLLGYFTAGLLFPLAHQRIKAYQHNHSAFGSTRASFKALPSAFFIVYFKIFGTFLLGFLVCVMLAVSFGIVAATSSGSKDPARAKEAMVIIMVVVIGIYMLMFLVIGPWFAARIQNLTWNNTALGPHAMQSHVRARDLLKIYVTNFILIALTLGLYKPFADIRLAKYRLEHMALDAEGSLDDFLAHEQQSVSALGEETTDVFDVDISF
jgi:uncharacterized membrane protein YjgN (DUF898 family)